MNFLTMLMFDQWLELSHVHTILKLSKFLFSTFSTSTGTDIIRMPFLRQQLVDGHLYKLGLWMIQRFVLNGGGEKLKTRTW